MLDRKKWVHQSGSHQICLLNLPRKGEVVFVTSGAGEVTLFNALVLFSLTL